MEEELSKLNASIAINEEVIKQEKALRSGAGRQTVMAKMELLENDLKAKRDRLKENKGGDPEQYEKIVAATEVAKQAAERWTDNVFAVIKKMRDKGIEKEKIYKGFGISADFDYLEESE